MRVLNKHKDSFEECHNGVDIMRGSRWGNPFIVGIDGTQKQVVDLYEQYMIWRLEIQPTWLDPLIGKNLVCCCKPKPCHGDLIICILEDTEGVE